MSIKDFALVVAVLGVLAGCSSYYGGPRTIQTRTDYVTGYTPGMTVETPTMVVTSPPQNQGYLDVQYATGAGRYRYGNGGNNNDFSWLRNQWGSPDWRDWVR